MKKQEKEIAINTSSGAEKVETIEKEVKKQQNGGKTATKTTAKTTSKIKKEDDAAKERVKAAEEKAKAAKARKEEQKAAAQKRKAERQARIAKIKAQREEKRRQRAHAIAQMNQERAKKRKERAKRRAERREKQRKEWEERKKDRSSGRKNSNGGWIAAVSVLGVTTLALTSALTVGAVEMKRATESTMTAYRGTMYELTGIMEHVDDDLERARISGTSEQQSRVLTDLLVQARMAELDLEKLPMPAESDRGITAFINRTAWECERMLAKLRRGESLTSEDFDRLESLYNANHAIRTELDKVLAEMTDESLQEFIKKGTGGIAEAMQRIEKSTLEEGRANMERGMEKMKDGMEKMKDDVENAKDKVQEKMQDMSKKTANMSEKGKDMPRIESAHAEKLCKEYFSDYDIAEYQCVGETVTRGYSAYNVQGYDKKGTLLFAEISQTNGALLRFDYYEDCDADTFDLQNAERIAEDFLDKLGYDDMEVVRFRDNGTMTDFTFVYEDDDVAYYPDEVHVKVCRSRGVVTAMDATKYIQNHRERVAPNVKISMEEAQSRLHEKLTVEASRLAVIKTKRGERAAYEFLCSYGEENYFVYVDGVSGEEISIVNAKGIQ
ncbi:MAG: germination protein YpeB [Clostridia bacterium]|nr:germination protein YpeB [Clostridia bacterium]